MNEQGSASQIVVIYIAVVATLLLFGVVILIFSQKIYITSGDQGAIAGIDDAPSPLASPARVAKASPSGLVAGISTASTSPEIAIPINQETNQVNIAVLGGNYFFKPDTLNVKKGQKVEIIFTSSGGFHNFVIDEYNVKSPILRGGANTTIEFTADRAGTFQFYSSAGNQRQLGMVGKLIVK